jgi:glycosyltransferase involved in cell wall biosynthesis
MAAYRSAQFLPAAIESVIAQTYSNWELNVVDDGSPDNTEDVVRRYTADPRIRYFRQPNQGQARAKNAAIRMARGDFLAFLDADDMWSADKLERQLPTFFGQPDVGLVHTNVVLVNEAGEAIGSPTRDYPRGWITSDLLIDNCVNGMASMIRRQCVERVGAFDESLTMGIDYDLWLRISAQYRIIYVDFVSYYYRQWSGQMSHRYEERMNNAIRIMNKFLNEHPGLVPDHVVRTAWAHTYVSRGYSRFALDKRWGAAFADYFRAVRISPGYLPAWKAIAKLAIRRP